MIDSHQILDYLPHRYPFLMVDKIIELEPLKRAVGIKNVTINEPFFTGHFPGHPVMPGVLIVEAMTQVGGVMMLSSDGLKGKLAYFAAIDNVRFRKPVFPGDQIRMEVEVIKFRSPIGKLHGRALVDGVLVAEGDFTISLVEQENKTSIHPTATIHPSAQLGKDVKVGAYVIIGPEVTIGNGTVIEANSVIEKWTTIGQNCQIHYGAIIGNASQDKKSEGERSYVEIGDRNTIREYVTINRATGKEQKTIIGNDNLFLTNVHIGHNCELGNGIIISNATGLSGHVIVDDQVVIGGMVGVTQFCRIGRMVMVGGYSKVNQDVPPFLLVEGNPAYVRGLNIVGLQRRNVSEDSVTALKKAFRYMYQSKMNISQAITEMEGTLDNTSELQQFVDFLKVPTERGLARRPPSKRAGSEDSDE